MAIFCTLYALPEEFHEISRTTSLKPWVPVYDDESVGINARNEAEVQSVAIPV